MTSEDLDRMLASLMLRGYIRAIGATSDGELQYEVTERGRFALAEQDMRRWIA